MSQRIYFIPERNRDIGKQVSAYINTLTKPIGSLGRLEEIAINLAEIKGEHFPSVTKPGILVFAADHGITEEGVSAYPKEVTEQMVLNFLNGGAAINVFSRQIGALLEIIDIGIAADSKHDRLVNRKIRRGTANFLKEDAMSLEQAEAAIEAGYLEGLRMIKKGVQCLILGEMGIGNTSSSSAIVSVLSNESVNNVVGHGTGITSEQFVHKVAVITQSIEQRKPNRNDPIDLISKLGGLEIAGMAGAMLAAAEQRIPVLVDGFICTTSALLAKEINANVADYLLVTHQSVEPGHSIATELLGKEPIINLGLRLGEGTGAAVAFPIIQSATLMLKEMATFSSAGITDKN
ncbi:nicotinate-nucleotide--dimethylbenzimidazole phosphoribosyltransferase [Alkalihalobacillus sp. MEB130]|uniref:nicotinate-nucleotide--dimethylbenzimidazole phosphoribosyltransferase n=1 Tax=Alkalihalobacillus sp. MEB130 TaxID=2976704 RepID=UPI0028DE8459|nr:nicotinate-nucleotide--dimethylbenzimidazole phosphoribosyltransferase [Alkalihalobacillus sp. MEB130]MDT8859297.1 nicotinate-nucleotide--dimethylbenzimidazole phosphoribosyltransferase [Alkalihalobacillus sp. MEB130]